MSLVTHSKVLILQRQRGLRTRRREKAGLPTPLADVRHQLLSKCEHLPLCAPLSWPLCSPSPRKRSPFMNPGVYPSFVLFSRDLNRHCALLARGHTGPARRLYMQTGRRWFNEPMSSRRYGGCVRCSSGAGWRILQSIGEVRAMICSDLHAVHAVYPYTQHSCDK